MAAPTHVVESQDAIVVGIECTGLCLVVWELHRVGVTVGTDRTAVKQPGQRVLDLESSSRWA